MGEVTKTRRTMIVPNQAIATYVTQWTYDSHNRLLEMIYWGTCKSVWMQYAKFAFLINEKTLLFITRGHVTD